MKLDEENLRKRFEQHQKQPPAGVWQGISARIKRRSRRRLMLWVGIPSIVLAFLGIAGLFLQDRGMGEYPIAEQPDLKGLTARVDKVYDTNNMESQNQQEKPLKAKSTDKQTDSDNALADNAKSAKSNAIDQKQNQNSAKKQALKSAAMSAKSNAPAEQSTNQVKSEEQANVAKSGNLRSYPLLTENLGQLKGVFQPEPAPQVMPKPLPDSMQAEPAVEVHDSVKKPWQIGINLTPFIAQYQYQNPADFDQPAIDKAESAESNGKGLRIGFNAHYKLSHQFIVKSGLGYEYQQQDYDHAYLEQGSEQRGQTGTFNNPDYESPSDGGDTTYYVASSSHQNEYHRVSLPLTVRYRLMDDQRWHLFAEGGIRFTYLFSLDSRNVKLNDIQDYGRRIQSPSESSVNGLNMRYRLQAGIGYQLSDQWYITAAPNIEAQAFSTFDSPDLLQRRAQQFGLSIGIVKSF